MSIFKQLRWLYGRNRKTITAFAVCVAACILFAFIDLALCVLAVTCVSVMTLVLYIKVITTEHMAYYRLIKNDCSPAPSKLFINSIISVSITLALCLTLFYGCVALSSYASLNTDTSAYELTPAETETLTEDEKALLEETAEALPALIDKAVERGYTSPALYITFFIVSIISTFASVVQWHTGVSFAAKLKLPPIATLIIAMIIIGLVGDLIVSILTTLMTLAAPGLDGAVKEINTFIAITETEENAAKLLRDMTDSLPYAATLIKVMIISTLCTLVSALTNALVSMKIIEKKL